MVSKSPPNYVRHPSSYANHNLHPPSDGPSTYSLILPDRHFGPPARPPRPPSISVVSGTSVSEDELNDSTPVIPDVRLPAVIVTPCTPSSTKASKTYIGTSGLDELNADESGEESSDSDASCIASVDSNPFLSDPLPPLQKEIEPPPPLRPGALNYQHQHQHHRARSLTGTRRGLQHQRLSCSDYSCPVTFPRVAADTGMLSNPVKKSDVVVPPLIKNSDTPPTANKTSSFIRSGLNVVWDSKSRAITDKRIQSYKTQRVPSKKSERSTDQTLDTEDPKASASEVQTAMQAYKNANQPLDDDSRRGVVPYPEVFDLDDYFGSSTPSESTLKCSLNSSCSTICSTESKNPFLISTTTPATCASSPKPLRRISNISDTTASSTSIYPFSLSNMSTDTDELASRRFGFVHIDAGNNGSRKNKPPCDHHEVKRYRDHYRPPAYSRSPAFVIESPHQQEIYGIEERQ